MVDGGRVSEYLERFPALDYIIDFSGSYQLSLSLWFGGFYLVKNTLLGGVSFVQQTLLKDIKFSITSRMFSYYMRQPYAFHLETKTSNLVRSVTYDVKVVVDGVLQQGGLLISEILLLVGVLAVLVWKNPIALSVFVVMVVPILLTYMLLKKRLLLWGKIMQEREAGIIRHMQEGIGGIKDAIILNAQKSFEDNFEENVLHQAYVKRNRDIAVLVPRYMIESLMMIGLAGALYWLGQSGGLMENISSIAFLAIVAVRVLPMSNRIFSAVSNIRASLPSIDVIYSAARPEDFDSLNKSQSKIDGNKKILLSDPFIELAVNQLCFSYPDSGAVLDGVDINIKRGETIGIVGGSGSGKTTLIDLLMGLLCPSSGRIFCNGVDIYNNIQLWQQRLGYVQQNIFLMDATIKENIAYGVPEDQIDLERIQVVIHMVNLDSWIGVLSEGVDSIVGERGVRISGGQRQRIGIARALYHNPEILILDEATSALDNRTEKEVMDDIYAMHGDRTVIMIAHRLDTIKRCDRVLLLDRGVIVAQGGFEELSKDNVDFRKIGAME